jgi:hypothetical protein
MLNALDTLIDNGLNAESLNTVIADLLEADDIDDDADKLCLIALASCRNSGDNVGPADCEYLRDNTVRVGGCEYLVYDEEDRDAAFAEALDQAADTVCEGYDETAARYFDRDSWKSDAEHDGAGCYLSGYDGEENEYDTGGEMYYLYRQN